MTGPNVDRPLVAFADEAHRHSATGPGTYILAAAICPSEDLETSRLTLRGLLEPGQRKLHWRDESAKRRQRIAEVLAALAPIHLVVIRRGVRAERLERQRRLCLGQLLYELDQHQVGAVTFESRGRADDARDRALVDSARARQSIGADLRVEHAPGPSDPMLWVPDAVCGAVIHDRNGDRSYMDLIETGTAIRVVDVSTDP